MSWTCPICQAACPPRAENPAFPFCSRRCQLVDLGRWLNGDYCIPGEPLDDAAVMSGGSSDDAQAGDGSPGWPSRHDDFDDDLVS